MQELIESYKRGQERLKKYNSKEFIYKNGLNMIWQSFESEAWYESLIENNIEKSKEAFSNCAKIDLEECSFNKDIFNYKRNSPLYAILSDNLEVVNSFNKIDYTITSGPKKYKTYKELVKIGKSHIYIDTIIKSMNKDYQALDENLKIMDNIFLKMKKNVALKIDYNFFKGILEKNKDLVFESINALATKEHKKRNRDSAFYKDLISQPAMGYAKIAWINGYQLEFDSTLIHNELLPFKPNKNYTDRVLILKENMTLESTNPDFNGIKLSEEEFKTRYPKKKNWLQQWI
ncbi:hypothetical protein [Flavicella marina]|uniref:hypothetical protein n=1 Tax=Flavicella marina TaxID=1475951 RepID=UPI0012652FD7|nr:hypothetical protein [Flavicella marina]